MIIEYKKFLTYFDKAEILRFISSKLFHTVEHLLESVIQIVHCRDLVAMLEENQRRV